MDTNTKVLLRVCSEKSELLNVEIFGHTLLCQKPRYVFTVHKLYAFIR